MATIIQDNLIDSVSDGRILQVVTAQGRHAYGFAHNLFNKYPNLHDGLKTELSDNPEENYARTISIAVTPNLVIDNAVVMYDPHGQVDENLLVKAILTQAKVAEEDGEFLAIPAGIGSGLGKAEWDNVYDHVKHVPNLLIFQLPANEYETDDLDQEEYEDHDNELDSNYYNDEFIDEI